MLLSDSHLFIGKMDWADPTLLICGDRGALLWLAGELETRRTLEIREGQPPFVVSSVALTLKPVDVGAGLNVHGSNCEWCIDSNQANEFASALRNLADFDRPGHAYLDSAGPLQVVASKGEYSLAELVDRRHEN